MIVFKFGGASVKDAEGIMNLEKKVKGVDDDLVVVVSALGKTTNALEKIASAVYKGIDATNLIENIYRYHIDISNNLIPGDKKVDEFLKESISGLMKMKGGVGSFGFDFLYDQIVSLGELWSTFIIARWLSNSGDNWNWIDIRKYLITDDRYRDANVDWTESTLRMKTLFEFTGSAKYIVQGFIGGTSAGKSTTLGREGSDYTAAIIANITNAEKVVVWKDVNGILNADPAWMTDTLSLNTISYKEAVEMSFSGAKVIHPKTIKPLHNKNIPLYVKSFVNPEHPGTLISTNENRITGIPVYVKKENQLLISLIPHDFSFVMADHLGRIFALFAQYGIKANLVQASAVSLAVCVDNDSSRIDRITDKLEKEFKILHNENVELYSIRQYTEESIEKVTRDKTVLVEQRTRRTIRLVVGS